MRISKYFIVESFSLLIDILNSIEDYKTYKSIFQNDISELVDLLCYGEYELKSGDYETYNFKIKVIEKYINQSTSIFIYELEVKQNEKTY